MDYVAEILAGEYGIRRPGKSIPMAASKSFPEVTLYNQSFYSGTPSDVISDGLKSSKNDDLLESLGMGLKEEKGLGFADLIYKKTDDPFLVSETDYPLLYQSSGHNVSVTNNFTFSDDIEACASSFVSGGNENTMKDRRPSADQNPSNGQMSYHKKPVQKNGLNPSISTPILLNIDENFDFYGTHSDVKKMAYAVERDEANNYIGIEAFFSDICLEGNNSSLKMEASSDVILNSPFEMSVVSGEGWGNFTGSNSCIKESDGLIFGAGSFQAASKVLDIDGDNEYRRRARYEQERRKMERVANALAEKNEHDFELEREKKEREVFSEELETKVKQWAAGREGNLRALISTLQDVLWPECGWLPLSLANLMTSTSVKKAYAKAALCIHPDKVQQKGATLRQKYVAEKVFYVLTEALNKFSSEELS